MQAFSLFLEQILFLFDLEFYCQINTVKVKSSWANTVRELTLTIKCLPPFLKGLYLKERICSTLPKLMTERIK